MQQSQQVAGLVVKWGGRQQHNILIAADVFHVRISLRLLVAVVVSLVHYHHVEVWVKLKEILNFLQITSGEHFPIMQPEFGHIFMPTSVSSAAFTDQTRRTNNKSTLAAHGCYQTTDNGFTQPDHIGNNHAMVRLQFIQSLSYGIHLILKSGKPGLFQDAPQHGCFKIAFLELQIIFQDQEISLKG